MYNSIAPVELISQMQTQFTTAPVVGRAIAARTGLRHRVSVMLHTLASALESSPAPAR